jgi:hypothetical protein
MKHLLALAPALLILVDARIVPRPSWQDISTTNVNSSNATNASDPDVTVAIAVDLWRESIDRGTKLMTGMKSDDATAATLYGFPTDTAESPFDGSLIEELREWGYNDNTPAMQTLHDKECNMASKSGHMLSKAFAALGMGTASKGAGGPNECFQIEHYGGPTTIKNSDGTLPEKREQHYPACGTTYRATGAEYTIGINAAAGALFALNRKSSPKAARELWRRKPDPIELPHLRSASDISWAAWNRAVASTPGAQIARVKYFMNMMVINKETNQHIRRALSSLTPPLEEVLSWLGTEFSMDSEQGKALLGSPVGRWAGYFLLQHKRQLGGSKWIEKVRVFRSEKEGSWPYLLFYVAGPEAGMDTVQGDGSMKKIKAKL